MYVSLRKIFKTKKKTKKNKTKQNTKKDEQIVQYYHNEYTKFK